MPMTTNDNEKPMHREKKKAPGTRFVQELDLLMLEGHLYCFDKKEAKRRSGKLRLKDARNGELTIDVNPNYGQPSVLAYKVELAALHKIVTQGCTLDENGKCIFNGEVLLWCRELARLTNRKWSTAASEQLYEAIMQLLVTRVNEPRPADVKGEWKFKNFSLFSDAEFSGSGDALSRVLITVHPHVIENLNQWHVAFFNLDRLEILEPIGIALYKNLCFNFSKLMTTRKGRSDFEYKKAYASVCSEWLGGLKQARYKADIKKQLGNHIRGLKAAGLIRYTSQNPNDPDDPKAVIVANAKSNGFNLVFHPGDAFFEDYETYYLRKHK